jgi:transcriptional regulator with XRE-family HTH domain
MSLVRRTGNPTKSFGLAEIEALRAAAGISKGDLERAAGLPHSYYGKLLAGRFRPRRDMIARLNLALARSRRQAEGNVSGGFLQALTYRMAVAVAGRALGVEPAMVHGQDPARRATQSAEWMQAAEVRRVAIYLLNTAAGLGQSKVARAAGMTKQAVSLACREIEERRTDAAFDRLLDRLTADIQGEW